MIAVGKLTLVTWCLHFALNYSTIKVKKHILQTVCFKCGSSSQVNSKLDENIYYI